MEAFEKLYRRIRAALIVALVCDALAAASAQAWSADAREVWANCAAVGLFILAWLLVAVAGMAKMRARASGATPARAEVAARPRELRGDVKALRAGLLQGLLGGAVLAAFLAFTQGDWWHYPWFVELASVEGKILKTAIVHRFTYSKGKQKEAFIPEVSYLYTVEGKTFENSHVEFIDSSYDDDQGVSKVIAQYPVGSEVSVWYIADKPQRAALVRGMTTDEMAKAALVSLIGFAVGGVWVLLAVMGYCGVPRKPA